MAASLNPPTYTFPAPGFRKGTYTLGPVQFPDAPCCKQRAYLVWLDNLLPNMLN